MNAAQWFLDNSIGVFPIKTRDKVPACPSWDDYVATREQAGRFINYGVRLGLLAVADSDSPASEAWVSQYLPVTPFVVKTARGWHRYYRLLDPNAPHYFHRGDLTIEFRHTGQYVVGPGSIHATGHQYTAANWSWRIEDLPIFPVESFVFDDRAPHLRGSQTGQPLVMPDEVRAGERHDILFKLLRSLQARGIPDDAAIAACHEENRRKCSPPVEYGERERYLRRVAKHEDRPGFERAEVAQDPAVIAGALIDAGASPEAAIIAAKAVDPSFDPLNTDTAANTSGAAGPDAPPQTPPQATATAPQTPRGCPLTEAGDAEYFARLYRDEVRYDHRQGRWLLSDPTSGIWIPDPVERLNQLAVRMARARQRDANKIADLKAREVAWKWALKGEGRGRLTNALALARSVPPIADPGDDWDAHPFLLGVQNGVVDLETGTFRKATAADRVTMRVRVAYDPAATCPLWLQALSKIFAPTDLTADSSQVMVDFMQRAVGYSITGDCREECCFLTWGDGCNGKGVTMNTLGWLFGDYTDDMPYSTLERSDRGTAIPNDVAKLLGKRFITCAEVNEFNLNEKRLKALTGRDPMTARFLHKEFFTFIPVCKIWVATNNKPKILGQDDGIWRRIHLIPFTQNFQGRENKQLKDQLRAELPGILNWVIAGAGLWLRDGLNPPETVKAATAAYREESNPLTPFIDGCCVVSPSARVQASDAWHAYELYCRNTNVEPWQRLSNKAFFKAMEKAFTADKTGRRTFYIGCGLLAPDSHKKPSDEHFDDAQSADHNGHPEM